MKEIGGEFWDIPLQSTDNKLFPKSCMWFLSGRMALRYILLDVKRKYSVKTASLPSWCCDSMIKPFLEAGFDVKFYSVYPGNNGLIQDIPSDSELLLVMDYFGFSGNTDFSNYKGVVIRDLTHSVFSKSYNDADYYFGSLRKWCGVLTGGFAFGNNLDCDKTVVVPPNEAYLNLRKQSMKEKKLYIEGQIPHKDFLFGFSKAESMLEDADCVESSTDHDIRLVENINADYIKSIRRRNAEILLSQLGDIALFPNMNECDCPLFVPIVVRNRDALKKELIENNLYCPVHWPVSDLHKLNPITSPIYHNEISIICDQRYDAEDMRYIAKVVIEGAEKC